MGSINARARPFLSIYLLVFLFHAFALVASIGIEPRSVVHAREDILRLFQRASVLSSVERDVLLELLADPTWSGSLLGQPNNGTGDVHDGIPAGVECEAVLW